MSKEKYNYENLNLGLLSLENKDFNGFRIYTIKRNKFEGLKDD